METGKEKRKNKHTSISFSFAIKLSICLIISIYAMWSSSRVINATTGRSSITIANKGKALVNSTTHASLSSNTGAVHDATTIESTWDDEIKSYNKQDDLEANIKIDKEVQKENDDDEKQVQIVAFASEDYISIAKWWYNRMTSLGYKTHTLVLIDQESIDHFTEINNATINNDTINNDTNNNNEEEEQYYRFEVELIDRNRTTTRDRRKNIWYHRILYSERKIKAGQSILLTDINNIFMRYLSLADMYRSKFNAIFAFGGNFPQSYVKRYGFVVCGGMTYLRANKATEQAIEKIRRSCENGIFKGRCDDQIQWNKFIQEELEWDNAISKSKLSKDGAMQYGFEGKSKPDSSVQNFTAKIWDVDVAYRGYFHIEECPSLDNNWVVMPYELPYDKKLNSTKRFHSQAEYFFETVNLWDAFCGVNGTNRAKDGGDLGYRLQQAVKRISQKSEE